MKQVESSRLSIKAILFGLLLMPLCLYLVALEEMIWHSLHWTSMSLPQLSIFFLFVLVLINKLGGRFLSREPFSQAEMLMIYTTVSATTAVTAHDNMVCMMGGYTPRLFFTPHLQTTGLTSFTDSSLMFCSSEILTLSSISTKVSPPSGRRASTDSGFDLPSHGHS